MLVSGWPKLEPGSAAETVSDLNIWLTICDVEEGWDSQEVPVAHPCWCLVGLLICNNPMACEKVLRGLQELASHAELQQRLPDP